MNGLKKLFGVLLLLTCMILPQVVSAEKTDWADPNYNFRRVRTIVVLDLTASADMYDVSNAVRMKMEGDYLKYSNKLKCEVLTEDQARRILGLSPNASHQQLCNRLSEIADLWIESDINTWENTSYIVPARTVWEDKKRTRRIRDRWGYWREDTYYESVPVTYPPYRVDTSIIVANFGVHDTRNGKLVFIREDNRSRDDRDAQKDMFGRMANSFFEDFAKKVR